MTAASSNLLKVYSRICKIKLAYLLSFVICCVLANLVEISFYHRLGRLWIILTFYKLKRDTKCPPPVSFEAQPQMGLKNHQLRSSDVRLFAETDLSEGEPRKEANMGETGFSTYKIQGNKRKKEQNNGYNEKLE